MASVFNVFLDHWMMEENVAKKKAYYKKMGVRVNGVVISKLLVREFGELLSVFHQTGGQDQELITRLQNVGFRLVMIRACVGFCGHCGSHCMQHEIQGSDLIVVCQNERCRNVCFFFAGLF